MAALPSFQPGLEPTVLPAACPVQASLGVLGRKWALLVLRDVAFYEGPRFGQILALNAGLTPRVLSFRLRDLQRAGFIEKRPGPAPRQHTYHLTKKGQDTMPIIAAFMAFGFKHHAKTVWTDGCPRTLGDVLPGRAREMLGPLADYALM